MAHMDGAERLRILDRAATTLSRTTETLLKTSDEQDLLDDVCRIAVEAAGYRLAWIGLTRPDALKTVTPVAHAGAGAEYVRRITVSWDDGDLGRGPVGTAIRTGAPQTVADTETDPAFAPWRDAAREFGFRSVAALPLRQGATVLGAVAIYAGEPDAFDPAVMHLLEDLANNLSHGIGALRIKAEHNRAVRELAESEERYRSLIELIPDAILVHAQGMVLFANPAAASLFGAAAPDQLAGCPIGDFLGVGHDHEQGRQVMECRMARLDGVAFDAETVATTISFQGLPARLLVVRDVTERKLVQQQLVQTAKMATLGEMAAGLVHELSQPLNVMRLTAEGALLFIERGKASPEWQAQQFELIADQAQRTAEIIDHIRIFSRRDTTPEVTFDALAPIRSAMGALEGQVRPDDIALEADFPATVLPVRGRPVQLEQVVLNLISNAAHAVRERRAESGPDYRPVIRVAAGRKHGRAVIRVMDNGKGISREVGTRIFEPFFTTKESGQGTGLGLSISVGIVTAMGGSLEMEERTEGACFVIALPLDGTAAEPARAAPPHQQSVGEADAHIMVVDDDEAAARTLASNLTEMGYRVTLCSSGREAYDRFMADPADVVITDLRMPAGTGEQLLEKLRDYDPLLPVIIASGHHLATESLDEALRDDRCVIMMKPLALARLTEALSRLLQPPSEEETP